VARVILILHDPIYGQDVLVAIAEPDEDRIMRALAKIGYTVSDPEEMTELMVMGAASGRTVMDRDSGALVIRLSSLKFTPQSIGYLVHECTHAATMLFDRIGFPIDTEHDEPLAYYTQWLVRSILEKVRKK
jgi:hypothetical protein